MKNLFKYYVLYERRGTYWSWLYGDESKSAVETHRKDHNYSRATIILGTNLDFLDTPALIHDKVSS